jgi:hypothetical protein
VASKGIRYLSFLHKTAQAIRISLFATTATFWWVRAISCDNQTLSPEACLVRYCITTRAPCTNSLRRYEFLRLLMPSNFCLPPVEYSRGTIPTQAARSFPRRKLAPLPIAATKAVAVTGPTPGMAVSRWQASFSLAVCWITVSICSIRAVSRSSSNGQSQSTFEQQTANLVDDRGSSLHPALSHPMHGPHIQMLLSFDRYEAHRRPPDCFCDGFRIDVVALVRLYVGLHVLGWHQTYIVTLSSQGPPEEM